MPDALQLRVTGSFLATVMSRGFSIMTGLLPSPLSAVASAVNGVAAKMKKCKVSLRRSPILYFAHEENRLPSMGSSDQHLYQWDKKNRPCSKAACYPRRCGGGWLFRAKKCEPFFARLNPNVLFHYTKCHSHVYRCLSSSSTRQPPRKTTLPKTVLFFGHCNPK